MIEVLTVTTIFVVIVQHMHVVVSSLSLTIFCLRGQHGPMVPRELLYLLSQVRCTIMDVRC